VFGRLPGVEYDGGRVDAVADLRAVGDDASAAEFRLGHRVSPWFDPAVCREVCAPRLARQMDWLPLTAFVISLLALGLSAVNSWVNFRNRADKKSVWMTLTRAPERRQRTFGSFPHTYYVEVWTLSNGGEGTVMAAEVGLELSDGRAFEFRTVDRLSSNESVTATPVSQLPKELEGAEAGGRIALSSTAVVPRRRLGGAELTGDGNSRELPCWKPGRTPAESALPPGPVEPVQRDQPREHEEADDDRAAHQQHRIFVSHAAACRSVCLGSMRFRSSASSSSSSSGSAVKRARSRIPRSLSRAVTSSLMRPWSYSGFARRTFVSRLIAPAALRRPMTRASFSSSICDSKGNSAATSMLGRPALPEKTMPSSSGATEAM